MVWNVAAMLRIVALKINRNDKSIPVFSYVLTVTCGSCYIYIYQISTAWYLLVRWPETGDMLAAVMVFSIATTSLIGITKLIFAYIYRENIQSMVAGYIAFDKMPVAPADRVVVASRLRAVKIRGIVFFTVIMGIGFVYDLQALVKPGRRLMDDDQVLYGLEPMLETPNYQIALVITVLSVTFIDFLVANMTALLIITTGYSEARLLALSQEVKLLWQDARHHYRENFEVDYKEGDKSATSEINIYIKHRLRGIIKNHATNVGLIQKVGDVFSKTIIAEFILLTLSLIGDLLGGLEKTYIITPFALMQVSMDCFVGQRLIDASIAFENAVYDCKWENFDASNMKTVQVILHVSQKTLQVSAGGVATLSFGVLMSLIRSVYSAYTALRSSMH